MQRYEKYKPSGVEWIEEIPEHWSIRKLGRLGHFFKGSGIKKDEVKAFGLPCIRYGEIYTKYDRVVYNTASFIDEETSRNSQTIKKGDVLFAGSGETVEDIGKSILYFASSDGYAGGDIIVLRIEKEMDSLYSSFLLNAPFVQQQKTLFAKGEIIVHIYAKDLREIFVTLPPLKEQIAAAAYLERKTAQINDLILKKKQLVGALIEERTAVIDYAIKGEDKGWSVKKLKYLARLRDEQLDNTNFKIAVENIESGSGKLINLNESKIYQGTLLAFKKGDTLFNKLRPYLHKVYFAERDGGIYGELLVLHSLGELIPEFLYYKLFAKSFIDIVDGSTQGTKMPRANWDSFISHLPVSYPSAKEEQQKIVSYIQSETEKIDAAISKIEAEIQLIQEYRTALISEVVTGKIKVV